MRPQRYEPRRGDSTATPVAPPGLDLMISIRSIITQGSRPGLLTAAPAGLKHRDRATPVTTTGRRSQTTGPLMLDLKYVLEHVEDVRTNCVNRNVQVEVL